MEKIVVLIVSSSPTGKTLALIVFQVLYSKLPETNESRSNPSHGAAMSKARRSLFAQQRILITYQYLRLESKISRFCGSRR